MFEGDHDLNDAIAHALKTHHLPEQGSHNTELSNREIRGAYMDMDPTFHEPDGRVRSNISPNKWKHSDLPPFPMYPNRETRGPPFDPPRHGLDVRRVCHEPRRPLEHELPYFHSHHRQVEAYPPNEPFYQPPTPPLARSPPPDFRERPRYPDSIMQHFEKLPAHDLRHQAGYRNYNRPSSSHHYTNYRATSPVRAMPRRRSPYDNERWERERDYDHSRRSRGRKRNTRSRVSNDNDNDIEYESFDRLLQKYKSIQKDVLPNLSEIEVKREKQIAHAIHNRIAVMQPNNSNESSSKSRETEKTSSEVETVEIDGKRIPISLIQDALRNVFQQAEITGLVTADPNATIKQEKIEPTSPLRIKTEAVEEFSESLNKTETTTESGNSVKIENDNVQNEELATQSPPEINPADEDQVTYDTPVSREQTTPNETTSTKDTVEDIKPSMPTPEIEKVITKEDPIQVPGGTEPCVVEVDHKVNDDTTETKANIKPKIEENKVVTEEPVTTKKGPGAPESQEIQVNEPIEEEIVVEEEGLEDHGDSDEDEELLKLRYAALTSAFQRHVDDIVADVTEVADDVTAVESKTTAMKEKKKKAKPKVKKSSKQPASKSASQRFTKSHSKENVLKLQASKSEVKSTISHEKFREKSLSPIKDMSDPKVLTLGAELQRRKAKQVKSGLRSRRTLDDNNKGVEQLIIADKNQRDSKTTNIHDTEDNLEVVEMETTEIEDVDIIVNDQAIRTENPPQEVIPEICPPGTENELDCTPTQEKIWDLLEENVKKPSPKKPNPVKSESATSEISEKEPNSHEKIKTSATAVAESIEEFSHAFDSPLASDDLNSDLISQYAPVEMMSRNESPAIMEEDGGNQLDMKVKEDKFPDIKNEAKKIIVRKSSMEDPETLRLSLLKEIAEKRSTSVGAPEASKPPPTTSTSAPMIDTNMLSAFNPPKLTSLPSAHISVPPKALSSLGTAIPQPYITTNAGAMTISTPSTTLKTSTESPFLMPIPHINPMVFKPIPQTSGAITSVQATPSTNLKAARRKRKRARQKMRLNQKLQTQRQKRQLKRQAKALNKLDNPNLISIPQAMLRIKTTATKSSTTSNAPASIVPTPKQRMQLMKTLKMDHPDLTSPPPQNLLIKTSTNENPIKANEPAKCVVTPQQTKKKIKLSKTPKLGNPNLIPIRPEKMRIKTTATQNPNSSKAPRLVGATSLMKQEMEAKEEAVRNIILKMTARLKKPILKQTKKQSLVKVIAKKNLAKSTAATTAKNILAKSTAATTTKNILAKSVLQNSCQNEVAIINKPVVKKNVVKLQPDSAKAKYSTRFQLSKVKPSSTCQGYSASSSLDPKLHPRHKPVVINLTQSSDEEEMPKDDEKKSENDVNSLLRDLRSKVTTYESNKRPRGQGKGSVLKNVKNQPKVVKKAEESGAGGRSHLPVQLKTKHGIKTLSAKKIEAGDIARIGGLKNAPESVEDKLKRVRELVQRDQAQVTKLNGQQKEKQSRITLLKNRILTLKHQLIDAETKLKTEDNQFTKMSTQLQRVTDKMNQRRKLETKFMKQILGHRRNSLKSQSKEEKGVKNEETEILVGKVSATNQDSASAHLATTHCNNDTKTKRLPKSHDNQALPIAMKHETEAIQSVQIQYKNGKNLKQGVSQSNKESALDQSTPVLEPVPQETATISPLKNNEIVTETATSSFFEATCGTLESPNKAFFDLSKLLKEAREKANKQQAATISNSDEIIAQNDTTSVQINNKPSESSSKTTAPPGSKKQQLLEEKAKLVQKTRELMVEQEKVKLKHTEQKLHIIKLSQSKSAKTSKQSASPTKQAGLAIIKQVNSPEKQPVVAKATQPTTISESTEHQTVVANSFSPTKTVTISRKRKLSSIFNEEMELTVTFQNQISPPVTPTLKKARGRKDSSSSLIVGENEAQSSKSKIPKLDTATLNKLRARLAAPKLRKLSQSLTSNCANKQLVDLFPLPAPRSGKYLYLNHPMSTECYSTWSFSSAEIIGLTTSTKLFNSSKIITLNHTEEFSSKLNYFRSHRLSPSLRTNQNIPISSLTFSNKINPHKVLCRYDLAGKCNDKKCKAQHWNDILPDSNEIYLDLLSYCPSLLKKSDGSVLTSADSLDVCVKTAETSVHRMCGTKISVSGRSMMTTEETSILLVSIINRALGSKPPHGIVFNRGSNQLWQRNVANIDDDDESSTFSWNALNAMKFDVDVECVESRYFNQEDEEIEVEKLKTLIDNQPYNDTNRIRLSEIHLNRYKQSNKGQDLDMALHTLCVGIEVNEQSEILWTSYLPLLFKHNQVNSMDPDNIIEQVTYLLPLSKPVWCQIFKWDWSYQKLDTLYERLIENLIKREELWENKDAIKSEDFDFYSCWLLVTVVERCHVTLHCHRTQAARKTLTTTLKELSDLRKVIDSSKFPISRSHLSKLWLVFIHLTEFGQLPTAVYDDSLSKTRYGIVVSERDFVVPFATKLHQTPEKLRALFKAALLACTDELKSACNNTTQCMLLYRSLLELETSLGRWDAIKTMCSRLVANIGTPSESDVNDDKISQQSSVDQVWNMWAEAILQSNNSVIITQTFDRAITAAPHNAKLAYMAALFQLNSDSRDIEAALLYLETCLGYYLDLGENEGMVASELHQLFRNLLKHEAILRPLVGGLKPRKDVSPQLFESYKVYFWLSYCMLNDLVTNEPLCAPDEPIVASDINDLYEAALKDVSDNDQRKTIWLRYFLHVRSIPPLSHTSLLSSHTAPSYQTAPPSSHTAPSSQTAPPSSHTAPSSQTAPPSSHTAPSSQTAPPSSHTAPSSQSAPSSSHTAPFSQTALSSQSAPPTFHPAPSSSHTLPPSSQTAPSSHPAPTTDRQLRLQWLKHLTFLLKRCLTTTPCKIKISQNAMISTKYQRVYFTDYSFHNQVASLYISCFPTQHSSIAMSILTNAMPTNIPLVLKSVEALLRAEDRSSILALMWTLTSGAGSSGLCFHPRVWKITTSTLLAMGKHKQALRLYQQSLSLLQHNKELWRDVATAALVHGNRNLLIEIEQSMSHLLGLEMAQLLKDDLPAT